MRVVRATDFPGTYTGLLSVDAGDGSPVAIFERTLNLGTLVPRPIKVGDRVTWGTGYYSYEVLGIHGGEAWLGERWRHNGEIPDDMGTITRPVSLLVKV